ncbi:MAG TPA: acetylxylan esterase [Pirellulaceae bacterium]
MQYRTLPIRSLVMALVVLVAMSVPAVHAAAPRVLPEGKQPTDARLAEPKDLNGYFPFPVAKTKDEWQERAKAVKRRIALSQGIWPEPEKTPLNVVVHGKIDRGDYTVEKVFFESVPGFFVTGNLYRPKETGDRGQGTGNRGKMPGILFAHGHWNDGRFIDIGRQAVRKEIVIGSERFEEGGRSLLQSMPVQLARMGCVCFHYDMIGYADSKQLSFELAHRFAKQRPDMNSADSWGLFSPQAEANLQSIMGLQTWNSVRALDFLLGLPEIDSSRVAITGASGGGTQTLLLAGIDPRVTLSFPAVMTSTAMQGGCTCENASCLRVGTGNVEFAALFAPKPQGMTAANDWTKELATKGFPDLKEHYKLLGAEKNVMMVNNIHFNHNYNYVNRAAFFAFLNKNFKLGLEEPVVEEDYRRLTRDEMTVWDESHPKPPSGDDFERKLCRQLADASQKQIDALVPKDAAGLAKWRETIGGAIETIVGGYLPEQGDFEIKDHQVVSNVGNAIQLPGLISIKSRDVELPAVLLQPNDWKGRAAIWLTEQGKAGLFGDDGAPKAEVKRLLDANIAVFGVDLFNQGEFLPQGEPAEKNRVVKNPREFAGYTYGYNYALLAQRAHDVLSMIAFAKRNGHHNATSVELIALDSTAPVAAAALARCDGIVNRAAIDTRGFRFGKLTDYRDANFLPGGAKYGDLPGLLSLAAPAKLWVAGESEKSAQLAKQVYEASGNADGIAFVSPSGEEARRAAAEWIIKAQ